MLQKKRIDYLDGLKGISAILVFLFHIGIIAFNKGYFQFGTIYGTDTGAMKEALFKHFPSAILTNNSFGYYLFFIMIPIFPIMSFRKHQNDAAVMGRYAVKRYFQLLAPCFAAGLVAMLFHWAGFTYLADLGEKMHFPYLFNSMPTGCDTFWDFLKTTFYTMWFSTVDRAVPVMWCMNMIFLGSMALYASYALFGKSKCKYLPCIVLAVLSIMFPMLAYFAIGAFITEFAFLKEDGKENGVLTALLFIVGTILVKLPTQIYPFPAKVEYLCGLGAGLFVWAVIRCKPLQKFLSNKFFTFLGRISFEIILVHLIWVSNIGCLFYGWAMDYIGNPVLLAGATFLITCPPTIGLAWLINKFVSTPCNKLLQKAVAKIM